MVIVKATPCTEAGIMPFSNPVGEGTDAEIEFRQLFEMEDFPPSPSVDRFCAMGMGAKPQSPQHQEPA